MKKSRAHGFHIAKSAVNPYTLYIGPKGNYVDIDDALLFPFHSDAREYAKRHSIELGDAFNVIIPCDCHESLRSKHTVTGY